MTPFDTALRVKRREVDTVKVSIGAEIERISAIETQSNAHDETMRDERALAASIPIATDAWVRKMKAERTRLDEAAHLAQARLGRLRAQAAEAFGTMRVIEGAADRFQEEEDRVAAGAEQSAIDDIAAARFLRARATIRKRPT